MTIRGDNESFGGLTREQKIERLHRRQLDMTSVAQNVFSSDVAVRKRRYIVGIHITNPDASPQAFTLRKVLNSDATEDFLDSVFCDAVGNWSAQGTTKLVDIENPVEILTGGQNMDAAMDTSAKTGTLTVWWYDRPT